MCCVNATQGPVMHVAHSTDHDSSHRFDTSLTYKTVYKGADQVSGSSMQEGKEACQTAHSPTIPGGGDTAPRMHSYTTANVDMAPPRACHEVAFHNAIRAAPIGLQLRP